MRIRLLMVSCIVGAMFFVVFLLTQPNVHAQTAGVNTSQPLSISQMQATAASAASNPGQPAIVPSSAAVNASGNSNTPLIGSVSPRIKSDDVKSYMLTHQFPSGPLVAGATLKIVSIDLITSKNASGRLDGESIGLPETTLVYFVKVQGPFTTANVPAPAKVKPFPPANFGFEVFNAATGNLMLWSIPTNGSINRK